MTAELLDAISLTVPADALDFFEAALGSCCRAVSFFHDEPNDLWNLQAVKERGAHEAELAAALAGDRAGGRVAGAHEIGVSRAGDRPAVRGTGHAYWDEKIARADDDNAGCRAGLWDGRA